jgi:hypothetical protein
MCAGEQTSPFTATILSSRAGALGYAILTQKVKTWFFKKFGE